MKVFKKICNCQLFVKGLQTWFSEVSCENEFFVNNRIYFKPTLLQIKNGENSLWMI